MKGEYRKNKEKDYITTTEKVALAIVTIYFAYYIINALIFIF